MANGIVRMIFEAAGLGRVRAAFRGVVDEARRADRAIVQSSDAAARRRMLTASQADREIRTGARNRAVAEIAADREIDRSRDRLSRADRARMREEERNLRNSLRARQRLSSLSTVGAVVSGVGGAALDRVSGYAGAIGIPSRDEMISRFISNEQRVIRLGAAGGRDPAELSARVSEVSRATNVDPTNIIGALEVAQNRFSRLGDFADNMDAIARAASAAGGSEALPDWVAALGEFQRQLGTSSEDVPALLGSMVDAMDAGSIEAADVAANFAEIMGQFHTMRGEAGTGMSGATEFLATAEAIGAGGTGPEEARTRLHAMMTTMSNGRIRERMERVLGRDTFDENGRLGISFGELSSRMADNADTFGTPRGLETIFGRGNTRAIAGFEQLTQLELAARANPGSTERGRTVSELMAMSSTRGNERIDETMGTLMNSTSGRAIAARINTEATFGENGDELIAMMTESGGALSQLTAQYPMAAEALGALRDVVVSLTGVLAAVNMASGGTIFGGGAAVAGAGGAASSVGGFLAGGLMSVVAPLAAAAGVTLVANNAGETTDTENRFRYSDAGRAIREGEESLSSNPAAVAEFQARVRDAGLASEGGSVMSLSPDTIRELAASIGAASSRSLATGAPADGRTPGEPGRR